MRNCAHPTPFEPLIFHLCCCFCSNRHFTVPMCSFVYGNYHHVSMIKRNKSFYLYLPVLSDPGTLDERILSRKKSAVNLFREYFARVMKMCSVPTPVAKIPHPLQHHNQQRQLQEQHQEVDSSPSSSSGEGVTAQSNNEGCWTLGPPICSDVKGPELYPILFEPPRRRIFGKLATNPFNKPANAQPPEPGGESVLQGVPLYCSSLI